MSSKLGGVSSLAARSDAFDRWVGCRRRCAGWRVRGRTMAVLEMWGQRVTMWRCWAGRGTPSANVVTPICRSLPTQRCGDARSVGAGRRGVALKVYQCAEEVQREELLAEARVLLGLAPHPGLPGTEQPGGDAAHGSHAVADRNRVPPPNSRPPSREWRCPGSHHRRRHADAAWRTGQALGLDDAVTLALDGAHDPR